jgi:hypothetical protein
MPCRTEKRHPPVLRSSSRESRSLHSITTAAASDSAPRAAARVPSRSLYRVVLRSAAASWKRWAKCPCKNVPRCSDSNPQARKSFRFRIVSFCCRTRARASVNVIVSSESTTNCRDRPARALSTRSVSASVYYTRKERGRCLTRARRFISSGVQPLRRSSPRWSTHRLPRCKLRGSKTRRNAYLFSFGRRWLQAENMQLAGSQDRSWTLYYRTTVLRSTKWKPRAIGSRLIC